MDALTPALPDELKDVRQSIFYGWWVLLGASATIMVAWSLAAYVMPVFYPELANAFHWSREQVSIGGSIQSVLVALLAPFNGWIVDRKGVRIILLAGVATIALSYVLLSGINSLWEYYVLCFFVGLGGSWNHHLPNELLIAKWFIKKRGLAIGILTTIAGAGAAVMPVLSGALIKSVGWRHTFLFLPILLVIPLLAIIFIIRNQPEDIGLRPDGGIGQGTIEYRGHFGTKGSAGPAVDASIFRTPTFWMLNGVFFLSAWSTFSVFHHIVFYLRDHGFSPTRAAFMFSVYLIAQTVNRFLSGLLCERISPTYAMLSNLLLVASAYVLLISLHNAVITYVWIILFGLGVGGALTCRPLLIFEHYGANGVGRLYGIIVATFTAGAFVGPASSGYIFDKMGSYTPAFFLALLLIGVSVALTVLFKREMTAKRSTKMP